MAIIENISKEPADDSVCPVMSGPIVVSVDRGLGLNNQGAKVNVQIIPVPCLKEKCKFYQVFEVKSDGVPNMARTGDCLLL